MKEELYDVTIVGGGPAGLYTAFYSGMRDLKTKIIEYSSQLGGRMLIYPEKMIWDVGGVPPILGGQLIEHLIEQAKTFDPTIVFNQKVEHVEKQSDGTFILTSSTGEKHYSKTVILAVGYGVLSMQKLEIEGADKYEVTNLHYTVQDLEIFRDKHVLISGGGNSAVDWANELEPIAASVTVVHRRDEFGGHEKSVLKMRESSVYLKTPYEIVQLHGDGELIQSVSIENKETGVIERIELDAIIVNHGLKCDYGALEKWGLNIEDGVAIVNEKRETNIEGIYGAGDFVDHPSKVRYIAGAFTDGILALNSAKLYLEPDAPKVAYVSSHNIRFKERNKKIGLVDNDYREVQG
ncbi:NAD(P)/FAD-dependent oxidoreductase [Lysinibacillus pakistanensis]|uniref:Ferredoxin--NADP reductase n=1 Tax=Lysinibacillus pakistanensis TaxID=759811 RepID=A0AAX3WWS8_9BACI|nr:NAD(P)/FAD-dependent oxidoreductase [Lysinibacillus pakistanensis]MDM5231702.1 NAD(P)/FAD-dependent oxidoreductase [Lysinibacillus pakistanensis]WHY47242.1 NAD(P)/FAD-dependent oxidoreductase [Lysinibacillus pakistanensis]WHY52251.1 NAD(P)/FAD-dependent oxidoreductase [Lysinibacillus pakistanensis]